jgi:dihydropteroate synthase
MSNLNPNPLSLLLGVLNVTPDSFSDGGQFLEVEASRLQAQRIVEAGADWLDLGGESTGPGSVEVSLEEELQRVLPVLECIREDHPELPVSIDTWKAEVARRCISMGAKVINDVTALRRDPAMAEVVADAGVRVILMHAKEANGRTTREVLHYEDVVSSVKAFFEERIRWATGQGIKEEQIILDPGLGFFISAEARYSFEIVRRLPELKALGFPLLLGPSRKSFLAGVSAGKTLSTSERLIPGVALLAIATWLGVDILRTHDVQEGRLLLDTMRALRG